MSFHLLLPCYPTKGSPPSPGTSHAPHTHPPISFFSFLRIVLHNSGGFTEGRIKPGSEGMKEQREGTQQERSRDQTRAPEPAHSAGHPRLPVLPSPILGFLPCWSVPRILSRGPPHYPACLGLLPLLRSSELWEDLVQSTALHEQSVQEGRESVGVRACVCICECLCARITTASTVAVRWQIFPEKLPERVDVSVYGFGCPPLHSTKPLSL